MTSTGVRTRQGDSAVIDIALGSRVSKATEMLQGLAVPKVKNALYLPHHAVDRAPKEHVKVYI